MSVKPIRTPFTNMSFTPDVPSSALGEQEYNSGRNVETDVRGINKILGDEEILSTIPGNIIFVTSGFRNSGVFWFIVATIEGYWYGINAAGVTDITPTVPEYIDNEYAVNTAITDAWNGDVLFINDSVNAPMYLLPDETEFRLYDVSYPSQDPNVYVWNYYAGSNPTDVDHLTAGFIRLYNSPNVGSLLISGNLTEELVNGTTVNLPNTVRWSQNFGLNAGPTTWAPTATNTANELEVPVRGPVVDGFPLNGNFYVCSYWDTVVFSPIAYQSSTTPVFGVKLINQGRGLLNENCWANADTTVFGLDARDIWMFDGGNFTSIGNQRVKDYFYSNLNADYSDLTFMINNTAKYQIEIYYADLESTGHCNKMLSYRYDLQIWNAPRDVTKAVHATESPRWSGNVANIATRTVVYAQGTTSNSKLVQKDIGNSFLGNTAITAEFRRDNISFGQPYSSKIQVHRVLPEIIGTGNVEVTVGGAGSVGSSPTFKPTVSMAIDTDNPWVQINQNANRAVTIVVSTEDATDTWQLTAGNWQITVVEDNR